ILSSKLIHFEDEHFEHSNIHDPRKAGRFDSPVFDIVLERHQANRMVYGYRTKQSGMTMGCGVDHIIQTENVFKHHLTKAEHEGKIIYNIYAQPNSPIEITKLIAYHTSRSADPRDLCDRCERTLDNAIDLGFTKILEDQQNYMATFWDISDVEIKTKDPRVQQMMRFNLFHICQATSRAEGTSVGARGLTGSAYDGHYFWDTEIFVLPFLIYTTPRIARNLLKFRYSILNKARIRAQQVNQKGALFPWRTINGEESSAYFAAGTAQYHINADIMYALKKYIDATDDQEFMREYGVEMLIETSRLWYDLGSFPNGGDESFHIHGVTGPDEYTAIVNNNLYTNMMARKNLYFAVEALQKLQEQSPQIFIKLLRETRLEPAELENWKKAAEAMYIPYDKESEIHPQDDNFLKRDVWDFENTGNDQYPLLLNYHPLVLYRHQVIKQADVVMAMFLLNEEFTPYEKKRNFDYYDPLTTGDSSLSACAQGIIAAELGYDHLAERYFRHNMLIDFADVGGNVADGAHIAAMGGAWLSVIYGIAGFRDNCGAFSFEPHLGQYVEYLKFSMVLRGRVVDIEMDPRETHYTLRSGENLSMKHKGSEIHLKTGETLTLPES
ncbi:MAG: glycoside hydrolase family 65 protein, partial [Candidatus Omnitrophica bacterium]|nr:glycoside hydrolase family 65 protein [Candidatus Omnitrophota bacterium]